MSEGLEFVFLKLGLISLAFHETIAHEFVHDSLHVLGHGRVSKRQLEADALSLIAIYPLPDLNYWLSIADFGKDSEPINRFAFVRSHNVLNS